MGNGGRPPSAGVVAGDHGVCHERQQSGSTGGGGVQQHGAKGGIVGQRAMALICNNDSETLCVRPDWCSYYGHRTQGLCAHGRPVARV